MRLKCAYVVNRFNKICAESEILRIIFWSTIDCYQRHPNYFIKVTQKQMKEKKKIHKHHKNVTPT